MNKSVPRLLTVALFIFCALLFQRQVHAQDEFLLNLEFTSVQNPAVQGSFDGPVACAPNTSNLWLSTFRAKNLPTWIDILCSVQSAERGDLPFASIKSWIGVPGKAIEGMSCFSPRGKVLYATGSRNWGWNSPVGNGYNATKGKNRPLGALVIRFSQTGQFSTTIPSQDGGVSISERARCVWKYNSVTRTSYRTGETSGSRL